MLNEKAKIAVDEFCRKLPKKLIGGKLKCEFDGCEKELKQDEFHILIFPEKMNYEIKILCIDHVEYYRKKLNIISGTLSINHIYEKN